jgi:branched-chain amino acid transport system substrate-binding protein
LHDARPYGRALVEKVRQCLREHGIEEAMFEALEPGSAEYDVVRRMRELGVEVIYYGGYTDVGGLLRRQSWEGGLHVPMLAGDGIASADYWYSAGPGAAAATLATSPPDFRNRPEAADVVRRMRARYGEVLPLALHAYARCRLGRRLSGRRARAKGRKVAEAARRDLRHGDRPDRVRRRGDLVGPSTFVWYTWRNGAFVELDPAGWTYAGSCAAPKPG